MTRTSTSSRKEIRNALRLERQHITNIIMKKNLNIVYTKVKGHIGIEGNKWADKAAKEVAIFNSDYFKLNSSHSIHLKITIGITIGSNSHKYIRNWYNIKNTLTWQNTYMARTNQDNIIVKITNWDLTLKQW